MQPRGLPYPHIQPSAAAAVGVMAERRAAKPEIGSQKSARGSVLYRVVPELRSNRQASGM